MTPELTWSVNLAMSMALFVGAETFFLEGSALLAFGFQSEYVATRFAAHLCGCNMFHQVMPTFETILPVVVSKTASTLFRGPCWIVPVGHILNMSSANLGKCAVLLQNCTIWYNLNILFKQMYEFHMNHLKKLKSHKIFAQKAKPKIVTGISCRP